jgi:hypothetical protein
MATQKRGRKPERPPFWIAFGFISAFAATILTVVLTGLYVRAPGSQSTEGSGSEYGEVTAEPGRAPESSAAESVPRPSPALAQPAGRREETEAGTSNANGGADSPPPGTAKSQ